MKRALPLVALLLAGPLQAQTPWDSVRSHLVRSRGSIRSADTQLTNTIAKYDSAMKRMRVDTVVVHDTVYVPQLRVDTLVVVDTVYVTLPPADTIPPDTLPTPPDTVPAPPDTVPAPPSILPAGAALIIGPQVPLGDSPWPWHDTLLKVNAEIQAGKFIGGGGDNYYDLVQVLYSLAERSQDTAHLRLAREAAATYWRQVQALATWDGGRADIAPRSASLGGLMLYALDGHGEDVWPASADTLQAKLEGMRLWDFLAGWVRSKWPTWLGRYVTPATPALRYGVRDGGYTLLHTAQLALVHPDSATRVEFKELARKAAVDYYARLQFPDGGWYWTDSGVDLFPTPDSTGKLKHSQPFMIGLLLDGMIAAHQATGDSTIARSILRACDWLAEVYRTAPILMADGTPYLRNGAGMNWRGNWYFVLEPAASAAYANALPAVNGIYWDRGRVVQGSNVMGGDPNKIREVRQMVPEVIHAFGYAYHLTGDVKYRAWGDEMFAASFGKGEGPGADFSYALCDYMGKQVNQCFRTSSRYLAWRR
jgi:hypothetical protein